jgi:hypothetical protein
MTNDFTVTYGGSYFSGAFVASRAVSLRGTRLLNRTRLTCRFLARQETFRDDSRSRHV